VVRDGETGLLVAPRDAAGLARAVLRMIEDRELAARSASAGRELAARLFPAAKMVAAIAELYEELLAR